MSHRDAWPVRTAERRVWLRIVLVALIPVVLAGLLVIAMNTVGRAEGPPVQTPANAADTGRATTSGATGQPTTSGVASDDPLVPSAVQAAVGAADRLGPADGQLGVGVLDLATGQEVLGADAATTFPAANLVGLYLAVDLLHQQESSLVTLAPADQAELTAVLERSDDSAMNKLWEHFGGQALIEQLVQLAGLQDTTLPANINQSGQWGQTLTSARDVLAVYDYLLTQLLPADQKYVLGELASAGPAAADGTNLAFGLLGSTRNTHTRAAQSTTSGAGQLTATSAGVLDSNDRVVVVLMAQQPGTIATGAAASTRNAAFAADRTLLNRAAATLLAGLGPNAVK